jgi:hypothetical protein
VSRFDELSRQQLRIAVLGGMLQCAKGKYRGWTNRNIGDRREVDLAIDGWAGELAHENRTGIHAGLLVEPDPGWDCHVAGWRTDIKVRGFQGTDIDFMVPCRQIEKHTLCEAYGFYRRVGFTECRKVYEAKGYVQFEWFGYIMRSTLLKLNCIITDRGEPAYTCKPEHLVEALVPIAGTT